MFGAEFFSDTPFSSTMTNQAIVKGILKAYQIICPEGPLTKRLKEIEKLQGESDYIEILTGCAIAKTASFISSNNLPAEIPDALVDDPIFSQNQCPITLAPIRFPMALYQDGHKYLFEATAIAVWYQNEVGQQRVPKNPLTSLPFTRSDLRPDEGLLKVIERRLLSLRANWDPGN